MSEAALRRRGRSQVLLPERMGFMECARACGQSSGLVYIMMDIGD